MTVQFADDGSIRRWRFNSQMTVQFADDELSRMKW